MRDDPRKRIGFARDLARTSLVKHGIHKAPVDIERILDLEGFSVACRPWNTKISGICFREEKIIGVNENHPLVRQRFTLAHEYGHLLLGHHDDHNIASPSTIDNEPDSSSHTRIEEEEADEFAGELLAPLSFLKESWRKKKNIDTLAIEYNVSREVICIQLMKHRLLK